VSTTENSAGGPVIPVTRSSEQVAILLRAGDYDSVLGTRETQTLDFKANWYRLDEPAQKFELGKDVAAMANKDGGYIIRGVKATRVTTADVEVAAFIKPIPSAMVDIEQHRSVVNGNVFPPPADVEYEFIYDATDTSDDLRGFLVIKIPPQPPGSIHILTRVATDSGDQFDAFVVPIRDGAQTRFLNAGEIWRMLFDGKRLPAALANELAATTAAGLPPRSTADLETDPFPPKPRAASATWARERLPELVGELESFMNWKDHTTLLLAAAPVERQEFPPNGFYSVDGFAGALAKPPSLRYAGFGLSYEEAPGRVGSRLVVSSARDRALWAEDSGLAVAATNAAGDFLTWGSRSTGRGGLDINPTVLVEYTYLFCRLIADSLAPLIPGAWNVCVVLLRARGGERPLTLPTEFASQGFAFEHHVPQSDSLEQWMPMASTPEKTAYLLVKAIYDFFSASPTEIRYAENEAIDVEAIRSVRG